MNIPFRADEYGKHFYYEADAGLHLIPYRIGDFTADGMMFSVLETQQDEVLKVCISVKAPQPRLM